MIEDSSMSRALTQSTLVEFVLQLLPKRRIIDPGPVVVELKDTRLRGHEPDVGLWLWDGG